MTGNIVEYFYGVLNCPSYEIKSKSYIFDER